MKAKFTFALAIVLLSGFAAVAQDTDISISFPVPAEPTPIDSFQKDCLAFCAVAYCASGSCGVYTKPDGQRACGCHGGGGVVGN